MAPGRRPAPRPASKGFEFVLSDSKGNPKASDRKLIRRHVMRGKNTREHQPPRLPDSWIHTTAASESQLTFPADPLSHPGGLVKRCGDGSIWDTCPWFPFSINVLDTVKFADEVDRPARQMIASFFGTIRELMYPLDLCCEFNASETNWFGWMTNDAAYLHALLFTVSSFHDLAAGRTAQPRTNYHVFKAIRLLNERLADRKMALADSTVAVVMSMAMLCEIAGDAQAARAHTDGLKQIVELRGGISSFSHAQQLQVKICRVDLSVAISQGSRPYFFQDGVSWDSFFESCSVLKRLRPVPSAAMLHTRRLIKPVDRRLYYIFQDVQDFSQLVNFLFQSHQRIQPGVFQDLLTSLQYRILLLDFGIDNRFAELLRLSMLAYLTVVFFRLPQVKLQYPFLGSQLRTSCQTFEPANEQERKVFAWAMFVGFMSALDLEDEDLTMMLAEMMVPCLGSSWVEAKASLKEVLWIDGIYDGPGQEVYEKFVM
ncbi:hypothetical protein NCS52_00940000 [Fusarium sp. LHS14.1]|nr:hypothetical protein NCS52_00940000 [Fusarium sp. LHS14.1]